MNQRAHQNQRGHAGFTLVEMMIVVAIIALLAALAVPSWLRARKRTQALDIYEQLRVLDNALDQYALDTNKTGGYSVAFGDLKNYLKAGTPLYMGGGSDLLGNPIGPFTVDSTPKVNATTYNGLSDVADNTFWSPYK